LSGTANSGEPRPPWEAVLANERFAQQLFSKRKHNIGKKKRTMIAAMTTKLRTVVNACTEDPIPMGDRLFDYFYLRVFMVDNMIVFVIKSYTKKFKSLFD
jgi:hypothetical protein